ncbi:M-phase-specific PLK1-interacting protein [Brachyhypopomus gauderio]|uniref:M-phase-specific PLK1-interacting protein n=1 Tax=Brachyhypopomus gauderio TaxID=698409 RepID=UPI0040436F1D
MQRPNFRHQGMGPRPGGFNSPPPAFASPPWAFPNTPPPFGPGHHGGSPNTPPREFGANRGGGNGPYNDRAAGRAYCSPRGTPPSRHAPYHAPGRARYRTPGPHAGYQGSPRTSTPFGSSHGRERGTNDMEKYYKPSMLQDPWADLQPVSVTENQSKCSSQQTTDTGRTGRYYSPN